MGVFLNISVRKAEDSTCKGTQGVVPRLVLCFNTACDSSLWYLDSVGRLSLCMCSVVFLSADL